MRRGSPSRPWRKSAAADPEKVLQELIDRKYTTLAECEKGWEALDPIALCVALLLIDIPQWLRLGLLACVAEPSRGREGRFLEKAWRERLRDTGDSLRAMTVAWHRSGDALKTWAETYAAAKADLEKRSPNMAIVDSDGLKKSYERVRARLKEPSRYRGPGDIKMSALLDQHVEVAGAVLRNAIKNQGKKRLR